MNKYTYVTKEDINNLEIDTGIYRLYVEIGDDGQVIREIGLDRSGSVVHAFPSNHFPEGKYGIFDLVPFDEATIGDVQKEEFEQLWLNIPIQ